MKFDTETAKGTELTADTALVVFNNGCATQTPLTAVAVTKIYNGNGSGGAYACLRRFWTEKNSPK